VREVDAVVDREKAVSGGFLDFAGERYYAIRNVDRMAPFFISVISSSDHWLFASSTGGLTAGRVSPESALFPYVPVDKVHESTAHAGGKTILRFRQAGTTRLWEPFNREQDDRYHLTRNLYKTVLGNKLCFEEINHELQLVYRCTWATSEQYGFVRQCELTDLSGAARDVELLDGLQGILPAGTPSFTQATASNLVDAYKWAELCEDTGLGLYALYSGISDRAEPCESLRANTVFCLGLEPEAVVLSSEQLGAFRAGRSLLTERHKRGIRGAFFVTARMSIPAGGAREWAVVADVERTQAQVVALRRRLADRDAVSTEVARSIDRADDELARIVASADGFQATAEEAVSAHHYANVLFNILRGGVFHEQHTISTRDLRRTIEHFNRPVYARNCAWLEGLPDRLEVHSLLAEAGRREDPQLERLCYEYLPITFGRRHGDPSRPWNKFSIRLKDDSGDRLLSYEGNWRDIFQNWEALLMSFPEFAENVIARFVNASTADGYNPYRITKEGIDWEIEEPDNPWSYIGYWGDHQIIYLLKLLELSSQFHPARIGQMLRRRIFSYANVPYRIRPFEALLDDPKHTVDFDPELDDRIADRVALQGADGRLVIDGEGEVFVVNLLEKLLVPLLAKLGNLVVDGGIWLNTQRPEWNDANNALVGHGLSMVTLCYMRRYVRFLRELLAAEEAPVDLSVEVSQWLTDTSAALDRIRLSASSDRLDDRRRFELLRELGLAASRYRDSVYVDRRASTSVARDVGDIRSMLDAALAAIDHSIRHNRRDDGLYHAYNLMNPGPDEVAVEPLYLMLEGQVAALSSGAIDPRSAIELIEALFESDLFRPDQRTFLLYPDRELPGFLDKNRLPDTALDAVPILARMLEEGDERIVVTDADGCVRFNADFANVGQLAARLDELSDAYEGQLSGAREAIEDLYETVFSHRAFTGRSGGMFGFEGLGCVYWHMVSKLLLAVQEVFFDALDRGEKAQTSGRLGQMYYRVREGIGFNKTPEEYGAFPTDPYSHTPGHGGAQQPGMTGQVKEEILTRFGELGLRVRGGEVRFQPRLLRSREFCADPRSLRFLDVDGEWHDLAVPERALAFTWCQVPVVYRLVEDAEPTIVLSLDDGETSSLPGLSLPDDMSAELLDRSGHVRQIQVSFPSSTLLEP
jgi:hypothetical protein